MYNLNECKQVGSSKFRQGELVSTVYSLSKHLLFNSIRVVIPLNLEISAAGSVPIFAKRFIELAS
jgi:hypothetical protein